MEHYMKKLITLSLIAAGMAATPAFAQDSEQKLETYVGVTGGHHDAGLNIPRDNGGIFGVVAGVDVPLGGKAVIGLEGNYNIGTGAIDHEYGVATKLGFNVSDKAQLFVRGGYQEVNFDLGYVAGAPVGPGFDDTDGDYLVGVGGRFKLNDNFGLRLNADTVAFDTTRLTAGVQFSF
jgi:outer membrane immunogenic protein